MKSYAFAAVASATAAINTNELEFANYAARFNKVYEDVEEYAVRLERFIHHDKLINEHNNSNAS